jgi:tRNA modification GTPase
MGVYAAVMTGKGTGAIATVQVFGDGAQHILARIFKSSGKNPAELKTGKILLGTITDGDKTIDQVTIGCEGPETFAINCHGNPLIVQMIMELLGRHNVELVGAEELLTKMLTARKSLNTVAVEAKLAQLNARTLQGTKILASQIDGGLSKWLENTKTAPLGQIASQAERILADSQPAKLIIFGCTIVLAGPPNSGKSTLLNCLAGRQKAIVTDIAGTTRDWVSAQCEIGPLSATLIDTAGLDKKLTANPHGTVERAAQEKTSEVLGNADLILLVLDNSLPADRFDAALLERMTGRKVLTVLNKSDLPARFDAALLPENLGKPLKISAKFGTGIETLKAKVLQITGTADFGLHTPVAFTARQENLLKQLITAESRHQAISIISELLNGALAV